jgi:hypothetical protein
MQNFFISYNHRDSDAAAQIDRHLREAGYSTIIQRTDMPPGASVIDEMDKGIKNCERLIAVLSPDYLESAFCKSEWHAFQHKDPTGEKRAIIPVIVRRCEIQGLLSLRVRVDMVDTDPLQAKSRLLAAVNAAVKNVDPPAGPAGIDPLSGYLSGLRKQVSTVRLFGDQTPHELERVFFELTINEDYGRHSSPAAVLGLMDAELRRLRSVFGGKEQLRDETNADLSGGGAISVDDLLRHHSHTVITGAPGCGKTTLLRYLAWQTLRQFAIPVGGPADAAEAGHGWLPIYLELTQLTAAAVHQSSGRLEELLFAEGIAARIPLDITERSILKERFHSLLRKGRVLVLLDGLDEVSGTSFFRDLQASVYNFLQSDGAINTVIMSTRPFASRRIGDVKVLEIQPLTRRQIKQFIEHYLPDGPERRTVQEELERRADLVELARVPALLGFILQLLRTPGRLTENKMDLYARITSKLAQQLDTDKAGITPDRLWLVEDPNGSLKCDFLRQLAFNQLFQGVLHPPFTVGGINDAQRLVVTSDQIRTEAVAFAQSIKEAEGFIINPRNLADDIRASAMLRQVGVDQFAFAHLVLQEYLAATVLARRTDCDEIVCRAVFNPRLAEMEVLPITLGMMPDPAALYDSLAHLPESLTCINHRVRLRGLSYGANVGRATQAELIEWLVLPVRDQRSVDTPYRNSTYATFASASGSAKEHLLARLRTLSHDDFGDVRDDALSALARVGGDRVVGDLSAALNDPEDFVREAAVRALVSVGSPATEHGLRKALEDHSERVRTLAEGGLRRLLGEEPETVASAKRPWWIPNPASQAPTTREEVDACINGIRRPLGGIRKLVAAEKLGWGMSDAEVAALLWILTNLGGNPYFGVRLSVAYAFERFSTENLTNGLIVALDDEAPMVRCKAAEVVGYSATDPAITRKLDRLARSDPSDKVRVAARAALKRYRRKLSYFETRHSSTTRRARIVR